MPEENIGMVQRITGPVVDILFDKERIPDIFHAITIEKDGKTYTLEVAGHLGGGEVRCISMSPTVPRPSWTVILKTAWA